MDTDPKPSGNKDLGVPPPLKSGFYDDATPDRIDGLRRRWETDLDGPGDADHGGNETDAVEEKGGRRRAAALLLGGAGAVGTFGKAGAAGAAVPAGLVGKGAVPAGLVGKGAVPAGLAGKGASTAASTAGGTAASGASAAASTAGGAAAFGAATASTGAASGGLSEASQGGLAAIRAAMTNSPKSLVAGGGAAAAAVVVAGIMMLTGDPKPPDPVVDDSDLPAGTALAFIDAVVAGDDAAVAALIVPAEQPIAISVEDIDELIEIPSVGEPDSDTPVVTAPDDDSDTPVVREPDEDSDISVDTPIDGGPDIDVDVDTPLDSVVDPQVDVDSSLDSPLEAPLSGFAGDLAAVDLRVTEQTIAADVSIVHVSGNLADALDPETVLDSFDVSIGVVDRDGWFVSLLYTTAEKSRADAGLAFDEVGNGPPPLGAASPEAAVSQLLEGASSLDTTAVISSLPPTEMGAIYDYAPLFVDAAQTSLQELATSLEFELAIQHLDLTSEATGVLADVQFAGLAATVKIGESLATIDTESDCVVLVSSPAGNECHLDQEQYGAMIGGGLFVDVSVVQVDGEWFVSGYPSGLEAALSWMVSFNDAAFDLDIDPLAVISPLIVGGPIPEGFDAAPFLGNASVVSEMADEIAPTDASPGSPGIPTTIVGPDGTALVDPGAVPPPSSLVPGLTTPNPNVPPPSPIVSAPSLSTLPPTTLPPATLPPATLPPVTLPAITLPPTLPGLGG